MMKVNYLCDKNGLKNLDVFFCDIDGTLINSDCIIPDFTKSQALKLKDKIPYVLISGRNVSGLKPYHDQLGLNTPYITLNGSYIYDNGKTLFSVTINNDISCDMLSYLLKEYNQYSISIFSKNDWYVNNMDNYYIKHEMDITKCSPNHTFNSIDEVKDLELNKMLFMGPSEVCKTIIQKFKKYEDELFIINNYPTYIEIFPKGASKGIAATVFCKLMSYDLDKALCAGDSLIDGSMFDVCKYKAAPANANPLLKEKANILVPSNNDDGLGYLFQDLLEN